MGCSRTPQTQISVLPATQVFESRVIPEDVEPKQSDCAPQTLDKMPTEGFRVIGTLKLSGNVPSENDLTSLIDQKACQMGADALYFRHMRLRNIEHGKVNYTVVAEAFTRNGADPGAPSAEASPDSAGQPGGEQKIPNQTAGSITTLQMQPQDNGPSQPSLSAPVIPMQTSGDDQSGQVASPQESPDLSPNEILMRPVEPDTEGSLGATQGIPSAQG